MFSDRECNAGGMLAIIGQGQNKVGFDKQAIIALCIWVCCVIYSSFSSASRSSKINMSEHVLVKDSAGRFFLSTVSVLLQILITVCHANFHLCYCSKFSRNSINATIVFSDHECNRNALVNDHFLRSVELCITEIFLK